MKLAFKTLLFPSYLFISLGLFASTDAPEDFRAAGDPSWGNVNLVKDGDGDSFQKGSHGNIDLLKGGSSRSAPSDGENSLEGLFDVTPLELTPAERVEWTQNGFVNLKKSTFSVPPDPEVNYTHHFEMSAVLMEGAADRQSVMEELVSAAPVLNQCGVRLDQITLMEAKKDPIDFIEGDSIEMMEQFYASLPPNFLPLPRSIFVRTLPEDNMGVTVIREDNRLTAGRPSIGNPSDVFISGSNLEITNNGSTTVHELLHLLGRCEHVEASGNIMSTDSSSNIKISEEQCKKLKESAFLKPMSEGN